jgi:hypothetical protein
MKLNNEQNIYLKSMGKALRITGIFENIDDCNNHCAKSNDGVIAEFGKYIFTADIYDKGLPIVDKIKKEKCDFEIFNDSGYYGMWCVRNANDKRFCSPWSFHFDKQEDAERFKELIEISK